MRLQGPSDSDTSPVTSSKRMPETERESFLKAPMDSRGGKVRRLLLWDRRPGSRTLLLKAMMLRGKPILHKEQLHHRLQMASSSAQFAGGRSTPRRLTTIT